MLVVELEHLSFPSHFQELFQDSSSSPNNLSLSHVIIKLHFLLKTGRFSLPNTDSRGEGGRREKSNQGTLACMGRPWSESVARAAACPHAQSLVWVSGRSRTHISPLSVTGSLFVDACSFFLEQEGVI